MKKAKAEPRVPRTAPPAGPKIRKNGKMKFGTQLPATMIPRLREIAEREEMYVDDVIAAGLQMWLDAMDGKSATVYRPVNVEFHRRLEVLLNSKDPAVKEAIEAVLALAEKSTLLRPE